MALSGRLARVAAVLALGSALPAFVPCARAYEWDSARNALTAQMQLWSEDQQKTSIGRGRACAWALLPESIPASELYAPGDVLRALPDFFETRYQGLDRDPLPPSAPSPVIRGRVFEDRLEELLRRPWLDEAEREAIDVVLARSHATQVSALRWLIDSQVTVMRVGDRQYRERYAFWIDAAKKKREGAGWFSGASSYECRAWQIRHERNAQWLRWGNRMLALYRLLDRASDREWDGDWGSFPK